MQANVFLGGDAFVIDHFRYLQSFDKLQSDYQWIIEAGMRPSPHGRLRVFN